MLIQSKHTREALINRLLDLIEQQSINMKYAEKQGEEQEMVEYSYAIEWLIGEQIKLIREALKNNELKDF